MHPIRKQVFILLVGLIVGAGTIFAAVRLFSQPSRIAYANLPELYNAFTMKTELESKLQHVQQTRKTILDSIGLQLNLLATNLQAQKPKQDAPQVIDYQRRQQEYAYQQQHFEEDNRALTDQYSSQIWKQINQYVQDYAKEQGYDYVLGGDGSGTLMYGKDSHNITEALKTYINTRYKGGK